MLLFTGLGLGLSAAAQAADAFRQLKGSEIKARFAGMELGDGVHWSYVFGRDGRIQSFSMGKPGAGTWRIQKDELCFAGGPGVPGCYQVWMSGQSIQLRREGTIAEEGTLHKPGKRQEQCPTRSRAPEDKTILRPKATKRRTAMLAKLVTRTVVLLTLAAPAHADPDWRAVAQALGKSGAEMPGGVYRVGLPRSDLKVTLDGIGIKPALALGSWLAFKTMGDKDAMVMGDLVLTQEEVNPVMKKLVENGLEITALHNHLLRSEPATMYMHVAGHGDTAKLAGALRSALQESKTPLTESQTGSSQPPTAAPAQGDIDLNTAVIDQALGRKGKVNGGVYQVSIPRAETPRDHSMEVPEAMGSAIAINFQPTGGGKAAITSDFVLTADEVNPVLRALRANGIKVTALHNHMLDDQPRLFFMHFWANDDAEKLAKGLGAALDKVKVAKSG